jgi:hypothetical protein
MLLLLLLLFESSRVADLSDIELGCCLQVLRSF